MSLSPFLGTNHQISFSEADTFSTSTLVNHIALVVVAHEAIVGTGRYVIVPPGKAEGAFAVFDPYQGFEQNVAAGPPNFPVLPHLI